MTSKTDMAKVGTILLLVGAILAAAGAVLLLMLAFGMQTLLQAVDESAPAALFGWLYGGLAILQAVGAAMGFVAYNKANQGDMQSAFVFGLIGSMLPPVRILMLLGAVFCKLGEDDGVA